jgi:hypothetical protein
MRRYRVEYSVGVAGKLVYSDPMSHEAARQYKAKVRTWPDVQSARVVPYGERQQAEEDPKREAG